MSTPTATDTVVARAVRLRLICAVVAIGVLAVFATVAVVLRSTSDGVSFHSGDQIALVGIGLAVAGLAWLPTRPRVIADADGVRVRGILGEYKLVPWSMILSIEFRPRWRWARLMLPGDETISLYAVQRLDADRAVRTMRALRELHARYTGA